MLTIAFKYGIAAPKIYYSAQQQYPKIQAPTFVVKKKTKNKQVEITPSKFLVGKTENTIQDGKHKQEKILAKNKRSPI